MQFFPEIYTRKDLNGHPNGGPWPMYTNDRTPNMNGQSFNSFYIKPNADQIRVLHPNEVLKQTMLRHENIFREQVQDLHRLHRRQRELMYESRRGIKESNIMPMSQNNYILSKVSWDCASMTCQTPTNPTLPWINPATNKLSTLGSKSPLSPFSFFDISPQNESGFDNELLPTKCKKPKRKLLDLELPADDYVDSEEENVNEVQTSSSRCSIVKNMNMIDLDLNLPPNLSLESENENIAKYPNEGRFEAERRINLIDLNSCADEDEALPILPISETIGLVPISPENKESLPPRQEQEDTELIDDLIRTAAETIFMISKSSCYEETVASVDESLDWFAGVVVSSMAHNLDGDEKEETKCVVALPSQQGKCHRKERRNRKISESMMSYGLGYGEKSLKSWGKVIKRRRAPRVPNNSIRLLWSCTGDFHL